MNDYLAKPFRREELAALIEVWVPQRRDRDTNRVAADE